MAQVFPVVISVVFIFIMVVFICMFVLVSIYMSDILSTMLGVSHLSLVINSSINFLIYFSMGKRFKAATKRSIYSLPLMIYSLG